MQAASIWHWIPFQGNGITDFALGYISYSLKGFYKATSVSKWDVLTTFVGRATSTITDIMLFQDHTLAIDQIPYLLF